MSADPVTWSDVHEIAYRLYEAEPELDPLTLRFTDLHQKIVSLEGFSSDPMDSNEGILEAIQMAWVEERED
ncbi:MAG: Fe-S cluster assembly protein IscX [Planctomycetes bacterium]|nr:Fe-S cluster assembly protein IscX [Planctomycetota bacterium]